MAEGKVQCGLSAHTHTHIRMTHTQTECVRFRFLNMSYASYVHATSEVRSFLRNVACSTYIVNHRHIFVCFHMNHIFLHKPFWNVITGRPQLPAEKNLSSHRNFNQEASF